MGRPQRCCSQASNEVKKPKTFFLRIVVPFHGKLKTGTLRSILKAAKITVEEFLKVFTVL